jgi:hypothetical protein
MYRLSLIVTDVGLLLAGSASAGPRAEFWGPPQDGYCASARWRRNEGGMAAAARPAWQRRDCYALAIEARGRSLTK